MERLRLAIGMTLAALVFLVGLPVQALLWLATRPVDPNLVAPGRFLRRVGVALGRCYPPWRLRLEGDWPEQGGPFVVVANHQSMLDIVLLSRVPEEMKWVAKQELFDVPWIGWMMRLAGDIPVRRGDVGSGGAAMERAGAYLGRGMSVMMFPEGTRSRDGRMLTFKPGAFRLAIRAGVPILPVVVSGTAPGLPKGGLAVAPCDAVARILPPFSTEGLTEADAGALRTRVRNAMAAERPAPKTDEGLPSS